MNPSQPVSKHRLLIIDDNPRIHEDIRKILCPAEAATTLLDAEAALFGDQTVQSKRAQFEIDSALQGQEGLAMVESAIAAGNPYTLAFVDVRMPPGWDGIETIRHIWERHPDLQVVICTAYSDHSWEDIINQLGQSDSLVILKKPFDNVEVLQLAHALTKKWTLTRDAQNRMNDLDLKVRERTAELWVANEKLQVEVNRRTQIESDLRASEERFQKAFSAATVPMVLLNTPGYFSIEANDSFFRLIGWPRDEVIDRPFANLNLFLRTDYGEQLFTESRSGVPVRNRKCRIRTKDKRVRDTLVSVEPVPLGGQECLLLVVQDITEQLQLEGRLRQSQKMEAIGQLAAGVAHDFNNLLTIIHGHSSLQIARTDLDQQVVHSLQQVKLAADRAAALTKQLLAFSRKQIVKRVPLNLADVVNRVHPMLVRMVGESITLEHDCPSGLPPILADQHSVEQILMNLVVNARDATPAGGRVRISAEPVQVVAATHNHPEARDGQFVRLSVEDNGSGIESTHLNRVFEPFFTTKPHGKGTGLGLSTVFGIAQQHEGWVEVKSKRGVGSVFHVFLPLSDKSAVPRQDTTFANRGLAKSQENVLILVVEDEEVLREFIGTTLKEHGFKVLQAGDGPEALTAWRTAAQPVDLLFTDMVMPNGISGAQLAHELIRQSEKLKVLYTTGYSPEVLENAQLLVEGSNFLPKPFTAPKLLSAVERCLNGDKAVPLEKAAATN